MIYIFQILEEILCSGVVFLFTSIILKNLSSLFLLIIPCQGNLPIRKYIKIYHIASKSFLLLYVMQFIAFIDESLAVRLIFTFLLMDNSRAIDVGKSSILKEAWASLSSTWATPMNI